MYVCVCVHGCVCTCTCVYAHVYTYSQSCVDMCRIIISAHEYDRAFVRDCGLCKKRGCCPLTYEPSFSFVRVALRSLRWRGVAFCSSPSSYTSCFLLLNPCSIQQDHTRLAIPFRIFCIFFSFSCFFFLNFSALLSSPLFFLSFFLTFCFIGEGK